MFAQQSSHILSLNELSGEARREAAVLTRTIEAGLEKGKGGKQFNTLKDPHSSLEDANKALGTLLNNAGWNNGSCDNKETKLLFRLVEIIRPDVFAVRLKDREQQLRDTLIVPRKS